MDPAPKQAPVVKYAFSPFHSTTYNCRNPIRSKAKNFFMKPTKRSSSQSSSQIGMFNIYLRIRLMLSSPVARCETQGDIQVQRRVLECSTQATIYQRFIEMNILLSFRFESCLVCRKRSLTTFLMILRRINVPGCQVPFKDEIEYLVNACFHRSNRDEFLVLNGQLVLFSRHPGELQSKKIAMKAVKVPFPYSKACTFSRLSLHTRRISGKLRLLRLIRILARDQE